MYISILYIHERTKLMISAGKKTSFALISVVLTFVMIISGAVASFAADAGITGSKVATPTELSDSIKETEVTLQIPAVKETDKYDIVFVMDDSNSTSFASGTFESRVTELLNSIIDQGVTVNVGVVKFKGVAADAISVSSSGARSGLVQYVQGDTDALDAIFAGIRLDTTVLNSNGTNIHGGLQIAKEMLTSDTSIADTHKYVILLTDGKTYTWNDVNGVATTIYSQGANSSFSFKSDQYITPITGNQVANKTKISLSSNPAGFFADFTAFLGTFNPFIVGYTASPNIGLASEYQALYDYDEDAALLAELSDITGASPYDMRSYYAYNENGNGVNVLLGTTTVYNVTNGINHSNNAWNKHVEFIPDAGQLPAGKRFLEFDPFEVINNGDGTYSYDKSNPNPDFYLNHPDATQKATYLAGHLWTDLGDHYNTAIIGYSSSYTGGRTNQQAFLNWLLQPTISDFSADTNNSSALDNMFDSIENDINYLIKTGTVTDEITDEFELIKNGVDTFTVKLDGVAVTGVADGENKWNFGELTGGSYPYVVEYNEGTKTITWKINVPVQDSKPISLTYKLEIEDGAENGVHDTNRSATLEYESFNGNTDTYTFPVPETEYTFTPITEVKFTKTYIGGEGYDNAGDEVDPIGKLNETLSFTVKPYKSFNREIGKTAIPVFTPDTYTITAGTEAAEVTATLPDYSGADAGIGDYWYEVKETAGTTAGVVYDTTTYYLHVQVVLRGAGVTVSQVALHKTAPADDGSYTNTADNKTEGFTNEYSAGEVTVTKKVTGNMGDKNKPFDITVTFTAPEGKTVTGDIKYTENGTEKTIAAGAEGWTGNKSVTISIKDGASVTFTNVPDGVTYTVVEADYTVEGYDAPDYAFDNAAETGDTVTADGASGKISDSADKVTVTNNKTSTIDVGVIVENAPFVLAIALVITAALLMFLKKRKKAEDAE